MKTRVRAWQGGLAAVAVASLSFLSGCGGGADAIEAPGGKDAQVHSQSGGPPATNAVYDWNLLALDAVRTGLLSDAQAARLYAMVNVAMYDAVNGIVSKTGVPRKPALVGIAAAPQNGDPSAAAAAAACAVLSQLRPGLASVYQAKLAADLAAIPDGSAETDGVAWGTSVGNQVVTLRQNDSSSPSGVQSAGTGVGLFRAQWSGVQFRNLLPFAIASAAPYVSSGPPAPSSLVYSVAYTEVSTLGNAAVLDLGLLETYLFWASGTGTVQPPGEWLKVAMTVSAAQGNSLADSARLFALLGMAMADAVAPTFMAKYIYRFWRPTTAVQEGALDGNLVTLPNAGWVPRGGTPGSSPEHVSGHSAFAGAATTILRGYFCSDLIGFSLQTDGAPNGPRSYLNFSAAESEAGRSRVYGGLHFEFSNQAGNQTGRGVAGEVLGTALLRTQGNTHSGSCPL
jgi:hypothetical protein